MVTPELSSLFEEAARRVGIDGSPASGKRLGIHLGIGAALTLSALYKRVKDGRCQQSRRIIRGTDNAFEYALLSSWKTLGTMSSASAERLFVMSVKHLFPCWDVIIPKSDVDPITYMVKRELEPETGYGRVAEGRISKMWDSEPNSDFDMVAKDRRPVDKSDCDMVAIDNRPKSWDLGSLKIYDLWFPPDVRGKFPKARCQHGCAVVGDKMYVFGGKNCRGYLNDLQALDLKSFTWSTIKTATMPAVTAPHSLIVWNNKLLSVTGLKKDNSSTISVSEFDTESRTWRCMETYGSPPSCRRGQSVTIVGEKLIIYGGEDSNKTCPLANLNLLDLNTLKWDDCVDICQNLSSSPSPRSFHIAACYLNRSLFIFGGKFGHAFLNDFHILDLQKRQWSRLDVQGGDPSPRAGHSGVAIGEHWFIAGGSVGTNEVPETLLFNMDTHRWSVVADKVNSSRLAIEGLSLVSVVYKGEDFLVSFGGYKSHYCNKMYVLKSSHRADPKLDVEQRFYNIDIDEKKILPEAILEEWIRTAYRRTPKLLDSGRKLMFIQDSGRKFSGGEASAETKCTLDMKPSQDAEILLCQQEIDEPGKRITELGEKLKDKQLMPLCGETNVPESSKYSSWTASTSPGTVCSKERAPRLSALRSVFENPTAKDLPTQTIKPVVRRPALRPVFENLTAKDLPIQTIKPVLRRPEQLDSKSAAVSEICDLFERMMMSSVPKLAKGANETTSANEMKQQVQMKQMTKGSPLL